MNDWQRQHGVLLLEIFILGAIYPFSLSLVEFNILDSNFSFSQSMLNHVSQICAATKGSGTTYLPFFFFICRIFFLLNA